MMPMSSPGWFNDLPEYMTEAEYRDLSEEISRAIEIVHGHVIRCESPVPRHNRIARRLSFALEAARSPAGPCLTVETDVDVVLWRVPRFTVPPPGRGRLQVHRRSHQKAQCPGNGPRRRGDLSRPLPGKTWWTERAQYATAGIPLYLVVVLDEKYDIWEIREFHLDAAAAAYRLHAVHRSVLELEQPVRLTLPSPTW